MSNPAPNQNVPQIAQPVAQLGALATVAQSLKQGVDSLAGHRGKPLDRAITFNDLGLGFDLNGGKVNVSATPASAPGGGGTVAPATTVVAGNGLTGGTITSSGTIALAQIAAHSLLGNVGTVAAVPSGVTIGSGLSLSGNTLMATGGSGTVTQIIANNGLSGGTITGAGTIGIAAVAPQSLLGNSGTTAGVPGTIAIGSGLILSGTTLSAPGGSGGGSLWDLSAGVPPLSGFTKTGISGTTSVTQSAGGVIQVKDTGANTAAVRGIYKPVPSTPYRVAVAAQWTALNVQWVGLVFGFTDGTKYDVIRVQLTTNGVNHETWSSTTTRASVVALNNMAWLSSQFWLGARDDGTNITIEMSTDGVNYVSLYTTAKSGGYLGSSGYSSVFFGLNAESYTGASAAVMRCYDPNGLTRVFP